MSGERTRRLLPWAALWEVVLFNVAEDTEAVPIGASSLELVDSEVAAGESSGDAFPVTWHTHTIGALPRFPLQGQSIPHPP